MTDTATETVTDAIAKREAAAVQFNPETDAAVLALRSNQTYWDARQLAAITSLGIKHASKEDLLVFFHYCQKTGLDPFSKEIYLIERRAKEGNQWVYRQVITIGIDGYRGNAQKAADKRGILIEYEDTIWYDDKGGKREVWIDRANEPAAAKVTVIKIYPDGRRTRFPATAVFESFADFKKNDKGERTGLKAQWAVMPEHMIAKCAEAQALRKAFPRELGGTYIEEELQGEEELRPPVLPARQRDPEADDDSTVQGTVVTDGPDSSAGAPADDTGQSPAEDAPAAETAPDAPQDGAPKTPLKAESSAKLMAIFREYKLGGKDQAVIRRAVVTGLLSYDNKQEITHYLDPAKMTSADMARVVRLLDSWTNNMPAAEGEAAKLIVKFADGVTLAVTNHEKTEAGQ